MQPFTGSSFLGVACIVFAIGAMNRAGSAQLCSVFEQHRATYEGSASWLGRVMAASNGWIISGVPSFQNAGVSAGAAFMLHKSNDELTFAQILLAPDGAGSDNFGTSVDIDGPWAVVGAYLDDHSGFTNEGSAHVFAFDGTQWIHHTTLIGAGGVSPGGTAGQQFGIAVAISGNTILVGAAWESSAGFAKGAVYVFEFDDTQWLQTQKLTAPDGASTFFGRSVAIDGDAAFLSHAWAWGASTSVPHMYAFRRSNGTWTFEQSITPNSAIFTIDGDRAVIGDSPNSAAHVMEYNGRAWTPTQQLTPPLTNAGNFGAAVALNGDRIVVGSPGAEVSYEYPTYSSSFLGVGNAFDFRFDGQTWTQHLRFIPAYYDYDAFLPSPTNAQLGWGVAIDDDHAIVGAPKQLAGPPMILAFDLEPDDCDLNGVSDSCDPDCNFNLANDACEIDSGIAGDCNRNSIPDACEQSARYILDDGVGAIVYGLLYDGGDFIWLNQFNVLPGGEHITHISLIWTAYTPDGTPGALMLYDDPDNDGDPNDAVLIASFPIVAHGVFGLNPSAFTIEHIQRTFVGEVGESFFVGVLMQNPIDATVAVDDGAPDQDRSWRAYAPLGEGNIIDLAANPNPPALSNANWMLRAHALDCNGNGTWDQCDIDSGSSADLNGNGIPDECEQLCPADITGDGNVNVSDLLSVINAWGACPAPPALCPADINADGNVNVSDLLAVINAWGACP